MHKKLLEEFNQYKKNNPNSNISLDLNEYPPVEINIIESKNKELKSIDSIFTHYNLQNFKTIEGTIY